MKREFLEGIGLTKEQTDSIMSEYEKGIEALKNRNTELECLKDGYENLKLEKEGLESELNNERVSHYAFKKAVICELVEAAHPSSILARDEIIRRLEGCDTENIYEALRELRISDPSAFSSNNDMPIFSSFSRVDESPAPINFVRRR